MIAPMKPNQTIVWTRRFRTSPISCLSRSKLLTLPRYVASGFRSASRSSALLPAARCVFHGAAHHPIEFCHLLETCIYLLGRDDSGPGAQLLGQCVEQLVLLPDHGFV